MVRAKLGKEDCHHARKLSPQTKLSSRLGKRFIFGALISDRIPDRSTLKMKSRRVYQYDKAPVQR